MALTKTMPDPYGAPGETFEAYIWIADVTFNFVGNSGRVTFFVHKSEAAANAGAQPVKIIQMVMPPTGRDALLDKDGNEIAAKIPPFNQLMFDNKDMITALAEAIFALGLECVPDIIGAMSIPLQPITN